MHIAASYLRSQAASLLGGCGGEKLLSEISLPAPPHHKYPSFRLLEHSISAGLHLPGRPTIAIMKAISAIQDYRRAVKLSIPNHGRHRQHLPPLAVLGLCRYSTSHRDELVCIADTSGLLNTRAGSHDLPCIKALSCEASSPAGLKPIKAAPW
jgi:hypothetical protein